MTPRPAIARSAARAAVAGWRYPTCSAASRSVQPMLMSPAIAPRLTEMSQPKRVAYALSSREGTAIAAQEGPDSLAVAAYLWDGRGGQVESSVELIEDRSRS